MKMEMKLYGIFILIVLLFAPADCQECRNNKGNKVDWWVMILFPDSVSKGYAFYDSKSAAPSLAIFT